MSSACNILSNLFKSSDLRVPVLEHIKCDTLKCLIQGEVLINGTLSFYLSKNWEVGIFHIFIYEKQGGVWNCFQNLTNLGSPYIRHLRVDYCQDFKVQKIHNNL